MDYRVSLVALGDENGNIFCLMCMAYLGEFVNGTSLSIHDWLLFASDLKIATKFAAHSSREQFANVSRVPDTLNRVVRLQHVLSLNSPIVAGVLSVLKTMTQKPMMLTGVHKLSRWRWRGATQERSCTECGYQCCSTCSILESVIYLMADYYCYLRCFGITAMMSEFAM